MTNGDRIPEQEQGLGDENPGVTPSIGSLPIEILGIIFTLGHDSGDYDQFSMSSFRRAASQGWLWPLNFSQVSGRWREIALRTPRLWTKLVIDLPSKVDSAGMVQYWLANARALPVDVTLWYDSDAPFFPGLIQVIRSVTRSLGLHANHVASLRLACVDEMEFRVLLAELDQVGPFSLQTLQIDPLDPGFSVANVTTMSPLPHIPLKITKWDMLSTLRVKSFYISPNTTLSAIPINLTTLKLDGDWEQNPPPSSHTSYGGIQLLSMLPQLTRLRLGGANALLQPSTPSNDNDAVVLLKLKKMTLVGFACAMFTGHLIAPNLECLKVAGIRTTYSYIDESDDWSPLGKFMRPFIERSRPPLTKFSLINIPKGIGRIDLLDWLKHMDTLRTLVLALDSKTLRAVYQAFTDVGCDKICPQLASLQWRTTTPTSKKIDWSIVKRLRGELEVQELDPPSFVWW